MTTATQDAPVKRKYPRQKGARVDIRTTTEMRDLIEQAATLQGLTTAEYVKVIVSEHAQGVVEQHETRRLKGRDRDLFLELLDNPPIPNEALRAAAADFKHALKDGALIP